MNQKHLLRFIKSKLKRAPEVSPKSLIYKDIKPPSPRISPPIQKHPVQFLKTSYHAFNNTLFLPIIPLLCPRIPLDILSLSFGIYLSIGSSHRPRRKTLNPPPSLRIPPPYSIRPLHRYPGYACPHRQFPPFR
jgi:hypothetical protein